MYYVVIEIVLCCYTNTSILQFHRTTSAKQQSFFLALPFTPLSFANKTCVFCQKQHEKQIMTYYSHIGVPGVGGGGGRGGGGGGGHGQQRSFVLPCEMSSTFRLKSGNISASVKSGLKRRNWLTFIILIT